MTRGLSYGEINARKNEIMQRALQINYNDFEYGGIGFDYEKMMQTTGYSLDEMRQIQSNSGVGNTPLIELNNITALARRFSATGNGARIFIKDEACNASGSFKARRASISVHHAKRLGYKGVIAATSGNYGAAVASQAAIQGLKCIVVQECFDSKSIGQPEILEKQRACEAYGAEVVQLTVGPELFTIFLRLLEETGYFNASLYTPFSIAGIETLGYELVDQCRLKAGRDPDVVVCTTAGGGNLTGTARGVIKAGCKSRMVGAAVDLTGLHMASDGDFNRKSFTTGHTGFAIPFTSWPDRSDCPRNAARTLRYIDDLYLVHQGEVFYMTEALACLEGLERGPAGNISLTAAFSLAQELPQDNIIVVQETEYTGAGKHPMAQLSFAQDVNGINILFGDPDDEVAGKNIVFPIDLSFIKARAYDLDKSRASYIRHCVKSCGGRTITQEDIHFIMEDIRAPFQYVESELYKNGAQII